MQRRILNDENICTVSSVVIPSRPVNICGNGVAWISEIEDCTIFPGMTRTVVDKSNDNPILKIVYKEEGMYEINESIKVYCSFEAYSFYCDDILIATIKRIKDPAGYPKPATDQYDDYEPYFDVVSLDGIDTELMMAVMAFPILRFAFR